jgi:ribulose-phosphate 3-epimerase
MPEGGSMAGDAVGRWTDLKGRRLIAPSLLSADFGCLGEDIERTRRMGAALLHIDVMDGHFVPNITIGPPVVKAIRRRTDQWLDAHLMISDPLAYLEPFAKAGADSITVHAETPLDVPRLRAEADRLGVMLGLSIRPDTPIEAPLESIGSAFDLILVMTVMPGFGGQAYIDGSEMRIEQAARWCASAPRAPILQVDGGIHHGTAGKAARAGARWFVVGSALFGSPDPMATYRELEAEITRPV